MGKQINQLPAQVGLSGLDIIEVEQYYGAAWHSAKSTLSDLKTYIMGAHDLATVLAIGNTTGGNNIVLSGTDVISDALGTTSFLDLNNNRFYSTDGLNIYYLQSDFAGGVMELAVRDILSVTLEKSYVQMLVNGINIGSYSQLTGNYAQLTFGTTYTEFASTYASYAGVTYAADYSANYTNRSLIDKGYLTSVVGAYLPLAGGTMSGNIIFGNNLGIDVTATGGTDTLNIGTSNADVINIGYSSSTVNIQGTVMYQNVTNLQVTDKLITINKGGSVGSGLSAGFEIEENSIITGWLTTNSARTGYDFQAPANSYYGTLLFNALTANRTFTLPDIDGTLASTANNLSVFAATTSAQLAGVISDETGSGALVFGTSPTFTTDITTPKIIGVAGNVDVTGNLLASNSLYAGSTGTAGRLILKRSADGVTHFTVESLGTTSASITQSGGTKSTILMNSTGIQFQTENSTSPFAQSTKMTIAHGDAGYINIGNYATPSAQRLVTIGQDTAYMSFGSTIGSTAESAIYMNAATPSATNFALNSNGVDLQLNAPSTSSSGSLFLRIQGSTRYTITNTTHAFASAAATTGAVTAYTFSVGSSTGQTLGAEINGYLYNSYSRTWANGGGATSLTNQREQYIKTVTYNTSGGGSLTISNGWGLYIEAPTAGTAAIGRSFALGLDGNFSITNNKIFYGVDSAGTYRAIMTWAASDNITFNGRPGVSDIVLNPTSGGVGLYVKGNSGDVGIGQATPSARLHVEKTTEQLRVGYDVSNYVSNTVSSAGNLTTNLVGTGAKSFDITSNTSTVLKIINNSVITTYLGSDGTGGYVGTSTAHAFRLFTSNTLRLSVSAAGVHTFGSTNQTLEFTPTATAPTLVQNGSVSSTIQCTSGTRTVGINNFAGDTNYLTSTGAALRLMTSDGNALQLYTNSVGRLTISSTGSLLFTNSSLMEWTAGANVVIGTTDGTTFSIKTGGTVRGIFYGSTPGFTIGSTGYSTFADIAVTGSSKSVAAWTTFGIGLAMGNSSYTDTTSSGTVATAYTNLIRGGTILASSATTYTDYYATYFMATVTSTGATITNNWVAGFGGHIRMATSTALITSAVAGAIEYNGNFYITEASTQRKSITGCIYTQTTSVTVANTVAETSILTSTTTLPANFFIAGKTIRIKISGYHSAVGNPNGTVIIKFGSTTILTTGAVTITNGSNNYYEITAEITCRTTGATGTVIGQGKTIDLDTTTSIKELVNTATTTIDTTAAQTVDVTWTWGTASASNTITFTNGFIEVLN